MTDKDTSQSEIDAIRDTGMPSNEPRRPDEERSAAQPLSVKAIFALREELLAPVPEAKHKRPAKPTSRAAPPRPFGKRKPR